MKEPDKQTDRKWALILGGSAGMGAAFAAEAAKRGCNLLLTARNAEKLKKTANILSSTYSIDCQCHSYDLSQESAMETLRLITAEKDIELVVFNAAYSPIGPFLELPQDELDKVVNLNCLMLQRTVKYFSRLFAEKGKGGIILLSSMASLQGSVNITSYAASKAFIRVLAEGLYFELKKKNVDILAVCAGATSSPNFLESEFGKHPMKFPPVLAPEKVAAKAFPKLGKRPVTIPGFWNALSAAAAVRILPRKTAIKMVSAQAEKVYRLEHS